MAGPLLPWCRSFALSPSYKNCLTLLPHADGHVTGDANLRCYTAAAAAAPCHKIQPLQPCNRQRLVHDGKLVSQVTAKDAVVLATGCPITKNLFDSAICAVAVHGKQYPKRR